jgi:hypothetical protein
MQEVLALKICGGHDSMNILRPTIAVDNRVILMRGRAHFYRGINSEELRARPLYLEDVFLECLICSGT